MKMKITYPLVFVGLCLIATVLIAFKSTPALKNYHHMIIMAEHHDLDDVRISLDGKDYLVVHCHKQVQGLYDMNPIINLVKQYETEGWELQSVSLGMPLQFWLRKTEE